MSFLAILQSVDVDDNVTTKEVIIDKTLFQPSLRQQIRKFVVEVEAADPPVILKEYRFTVRKL